MWALVAYGLSAALLLAVSHRVLQPLTRRAALALAAMPFAIAGKALLLGRVFAPIDYPFAFAPLVRYRADFGVGPVRNFLLSDVYCQIIPWHKAVRWALAHGDWPLWNPFIRNGDILAAAAQPAPYFPPNVVSYLLPLPAAFTYLAAIHLLVAALGAYLWMRSLECRESAALVAGFAWMAADALVWWIGWPLGATTAAVPWIFLGVRRLVAAPGLGSATLLVGAFLWNLLGGHPETTAHAVLLAGGYGLFELWSLRRAAWWRPAAWALGAGALALLLAAIQLLPILDAFEQSFEVRHRKSHYAGTDRSVTPAESVRRAVSFAVPYRFGYPHREPADDQPTQFDLVSIYAGSVIWPLALFGLAASRRRERWFLLVMGAGSTLAALAAPGVADLLAAAPPFDVAINERLAFGGALALAGLAGLGVEAGMDRGARRWAMWSAMAGVAAGLVVASYWEPMRAAGLSSEFLCGRTLWLLVPLALLALVLTSRRAAGHGALLALLLLAGQRAGELAGFYPSLPAQSFFPRVAPLDALPEAAAPYRVIGRSFALPANIGTMWGLEDARGYQALNHLRLLETFPLWSVRQGAWFNRIDDLERPFLDFLNVRFALLDERPRKRLQGWRLEQRGRGLQLWENEEALPRAFVPRRVFRGGSWPRQLHRMAGWPNFRRRVWIEGEGADPRSPIEAADNGAGSVEIRRDGTGYRLTANMAERGWIATSITHWRGWQARTEDGRRLGLAYANHAFVAIDAPPGQYEVRLRYMPRSFVAGAWVSALAALGLAAAWVRRAVQRARSASIASP